MVRRPMCLLCLLLIAGIWLGDWTGLVPVRNAPANPYAAQMADQEQAVIYGRIYQYQYSENSIGICLRDVFSNPQFSGNSIISLERTIVYMQEECSLPLGTWVQVKGKFQEIEGPRNPGEFDSRLYYRVKKIYYRMKGQELTVYKKDTWHLQEGLRQIRESMVHSVQEAAPDQAGILCAMTAGEKSLLGQEEKNLLSAGAVSHMVSISGMHVSLLGMMVFYGLLRLGAGLLPSSGVSAGMMILYGMMTGESVSAMRALGMFGLAVAAKAVGRSYDLLSALSLSVMILLLDNPVCLYYSGFLLSCGCICGVGLVLPRLEEMLPLKQIQQRVLKKLVQTCMMGIAVQAAALPLSVWFFYEIPMYGIFVNLLVVPTLTVVLVSGLLGAAAGLWQVWAGRIVLFPGCLLTEYYQFLCKFVKNLPGAVVTAGRPGLWQIVLYYGILILALYLGKRLSVHPADKQSPVLAGKKTAARLSGAAVFLLFWCAGVWLLCIHPGRNLEITCLDVGQGDGAVICTPQGGCYLVDGGSSNRQNVGQYQILPFLKSKGISCVDGVFISHTDEDHVSGLAEIFQMIGDGQTSLDIQYLVMPRLKEPDVKQQELAALAEKAGAGVAYLQAGDCVRGRDIRWEVLSPLAAGQSGDVNENSLVLLLEKDGFRGLFTGDIGEQQERKLDAVLPDCDFLKTAHHGSRYSTGEQFLARVLPEIAFVSASGTNTYGHPHPDTLRRLEKNGCRVFLTKDSGAVTLEVRNRSVAVEGFAQESRVWTK